jgi:hypothetical protein
MAYSTSNPPRLMVARMGNTGPQIWSYYDDDARATVNGADYFTDGDALGMAVGDLLIHWDTTNSLMTLHQVTTVTAGGAADVNDIVLA